MTEITLEFIAKQLERVLSEQARMRLEHRASLQEVKDELAVLTTMVMQFNNATRNQRDLNNLMFEQLRKLEEASERP